MHSILKNHLILIQEMCAQRSDEQQDVAPDDVMLISNQLVLVEVTLVINALVHLEMLENVLCKQVIRALSWASISVQELEDQDCFLDIGLLVINKSLNNNS